MFGFAVSPNDLLLAGVALGSFVLAALGMLTARILRRRRRLTRRLNQIRLQRL